ELSLLFDADYADVFEVRGMHRPRRGKLRPPVIGRDEMVLAYEGLDHVVRTTRLAFDPAPASLDNGRASYRLRLAPQGRIAIELRVGFERGDSGRPEAPRFDHAYERSVAALERLRSGCAAVHCTNPRFAEWVERSASDLQMMITDTEHGPYPYGGVPWFSTP